MFPPSDLFHQSTNRFDILLISPRHQILSIVQTRIRIQYVKPCWRAPQLQGPHHPDKSQGVYGFARQESRSANHKCHQTFPDGTSTSYQIPPSADWQYCQADFDGIDFPYPIPTVRTIEENKAERQSALQSVHRCTCPRDLCSGSE
jgi:hypothetical protein